MHTVMIGVVAAMFLASSAPAQEIENTRWDEGSNVAPVQQPAPAKAANDLKASALNSSANNSRWFSRLCSHRQGALSGIPKAARLKRTE